MSVPTSKSFSWSVLLSTAIATLAIACLVGAVWFWFTQPAKADDPNAREQAIGWWILLAVALLCVSVGLYLLPKEHVRWLSPIQKCIVLSLLLHLFLVFITRLTDVSKEVAVAGPAPIEMFLAPPTESTVRSALRKPVLDLQLPEPPPTEKTKVEPPKPDAARPKPVVQKAPSAQADKRADDLKAAQKQLAQMAEKGAKSSAQLDPKAPTLKPVLAPTRLKQSEVAPLANRPVDLANRFGAPNSPESIEPKLSLPNAPAKATEQPMSPARGQAAGLARLPAPGADTSVKTDPALAAELLAPAPVADNHAPLSQTEKDYTDTGTTGRAPAGNRLSSGSASSGGPKTVNVAADPAQVAQSSLAAARGAGDRGAPGASERPAVPRAEGGAAGIQNLDARSALASAHVSGGQADLTADQLAPGTAAGNASAGTRLGKTGSAGAGQRAPNLVNTAEPASGATDRGGQAAGGGEGAGSLLHAASAGTGSAGASRLPASVGSGSGGANLAGTLGAGDGSGVDVNGPANTGGASLTIGDPGGSGAPEAASGDSIGAPGQPGRMVEGSGAAGTPGGGGAGNLLVSAPAGTGLAGGSALGGHGSAANTAMGRGSGLGGGAGGTALKASGGSTSDSPVGRPDVQFAPVVAPGLRGSEGGAPDAGTAGDTAGTGERFALANLGGSARGIGDRGEGIGSGSAPVATLGNASSGAMMAANQLRETPEDTGGAPLPIVTVFTPESINPAADYLTHRLADKVKLLVERGGTQQTEAAVTDALDFLARAQEPDGRWTAFNGNPKPGSNRHADQDTALTGLATLCFLSAGHTPAKDGPYQKVLIGALDYLLAKQKPSGDLRAGGNMYNHGMASLALVEAAIMTRSPRYLDAAAKAARFTIDAQNQRTGGWRYSPGDAGDTSVLGWQLMSLYSAQHAGIKVPDKTFQGALRWLDSVRSNTKHRALAGYVDSFASPAMAAEAAFCRILLRQKLTPDQCAELGEYLLQYAPGKRNKDDLFGRDDFYAWYYTALALSQMQTADWKSWNQQMQKHLLALQNRSGPLKGSWDPKDKHSNWGGRVYTTALGCLTLEVYYRYLPVFARPLDQPTTDKP